MRIARFSSCTRNHLIHRNKLTQSIERWSRDCQRLLNDAPPTVSAWVAYNQRWRHPWHVLDWRSRQSDILHPVSQWPKGGTSLVTRIYVISWFFDRTTLPLRRQGKEDNATLASHSLVHRPPLSGVHRAQILCIVGRWHESPSIFSAIDKHPAKLKQPNALRVVDQL